MTRGKLLPVNNQSTEINVHLVSCASCSGEWLVNSWVVIREEDPFAVAHFQSVQQCWSRFSQVLSLNTWASSHSAFSINSFLAVWWIDDILMFRSVAISQVLAWDALAWSCEHGLLKCSLPSRMICISLTFSNWSPHVITSANLDSGMAPPLVWAACCNNGLCTKILLLQHLNSFVFQWNFYLWYSWSATCV